MARDLRASSERLGYLMNSAPYVEQTDHLKHYLQEFEQTGQPVKKVIDYAIQRYNGRTPVHLAASNGLWECLDVLLNNGGIVLPHFCFRVIHCHMILYPAPYIICHMIRMLL